MAFESTLYRLRIAYGFLEESRQDVELGRQRSAVDNAQLAVESSAKALIWPIASELKSYYGSITFLAIEGKPIIRDICLMNLGSYSR